MPAPAVVEERPAPPEPPAPDEREIPRDEAPIAQEPPRDEAPVDSLVAAEIPPPEPVEGKAPPPRASPAVRVPDTINLGLAAIVAKVPYQILMGDRPQIAESERITLPFPMIERQLGSGTVEIPAALFWMALPPLLKHHFVLREDINIALPLEEIFQNLPVAGGGEKPAFEPLAAPAGEEAEHKTPIFLVPAPHEDATPELGFDLPPPAAAAPASPEPPPPGEPAAVAEPAPLPEPPAPAPEIALKATDTPPPAVPAPAPEAPASPTPEAPAEPVPAPILTPIASEPPLSAPPSADQPAEVHLQPLRVFVPPSPSLEPAPAAAALTPENVILGAVPIPASTPGSAPTILRAVGEKVAADEAPAGPSGVEPAQALPEMPPPAPSPLASEPPPQDGPPPFEVLPSPAPSSEPLPEPEPAVAFTPDQPPPLRVEEPVAAVAVLHATVPAPQQSAVFASATINVPPPKMFRPMVLPPPIAHRAPDSAVTLAPTLGGPAPAAAGMISLAPAPGAPPPIGAPQDAPRPLSPATPPVETNSSTQPPATPAQPAVAAAVEKAGAREPAKHGRDSGSQPPAVAMFAQAVADTPELAKFSASAEAPPSPVAAAPGPTAQPAPVSSAPAGKAAPASAKGPAGDAHDSRKPREINTPGLHLHIPPLPQTQTPATPSNQEPAPPALPLSRFDQHTLQSLFMTDETLDLPKLSRLAATLPGIQACIIATRGETFSGGALPAGFDLSTLLGVSPQVGVAAGRLPIGELKNFTLYGGDYAVSFFERASICLCAVHRARCFIPGVREKLVAVADELARV